MNISIARGNARQAAAARPSLIVPLLHFAMAWIYALLLVQVYALLSERWEYLGFYYHSIGLDRQLLLVTISALPAVFLRSRPRAITDFVKWLLYYILFLPALIIPPIQGHLEGSLTVRLFCVLFVSICLFLILLREGKPLPSIRVGPRTFWGGILILYAVAHGLIFFYFRDVLNFATLATVYEQRSQAAATAQSTLILYLLSNMSGALNPFLIAVGLHLRNGFLVALGFLGQVLIYMTLAGKIVIAYALMISAVYLLFDKKGNFRTGRFGVGMIFVALVGPIFVIDGLGSEALLSFADLIYMRTATLPGVLVGVYEDFFSQYPLTYFSHSIIGRPFLDYPYPGESVGQVIGRYVTPTASYAVNNYNANFIAADGIASLGLVGIPIIMLIAGLLFWIIARAINVLDVRASCAALTPFVMLVADSSLFTTMLTGGGALIILLLYLWRGALESARLRARR